MYAGVTQQLLKTEDAMRFFAVLSLQAGARPQTVLLITAFIINTPEFTKVIDMLQSSKLAVCEETVS